MTNAFSITIDGRAVEVQPGESVLAASRKLGLDIPTLCYLEKCGPLNTCQVCLVKINGKLVPSCGTKVTPEMVVQSETTEVHEARRTALRQLDGDQVVSAIREAVLLEHGLALDAVVILQPPTLPRTSSGKVQRRACAQAFAANELAEAFRWEAPRPEIGRAHV